jgi:hypothetical protein
MGTPLTMPPSQEVMPPSACVGCCACGSPPWGHAGKLGTELSVTRKKIFIWILKKKEREEQEEKEGLLDTAILEVTGLLTTFSGSGEAREEEGRRRRRWGRGGGELPLPPLGPTYYCHLYHPF